jgi:hypothetical protein
MEKVVFVKCHFSPGSFPTEYTFRVDSSAGVFYGAAPVRYCLTADRKPLSAVPEGGVEGRLVGLLIGPQPPGTPVRVYLPDGELYDLAEDQIEFQAGSFGRVPVGS